MLDVIVCHPLFPTLPDHVCGQISFLSLDWLLGEDRVERWVGAVDVGGTPPPDARQPAELRSAVDRQAVEYEEPGWVVLSAEDRKGWPILATAQQPLLPVRFPRFDTHVTVTLAFRNATDSGLPVGGSLEALRALEDELGRIVGEDGDLLAHESSRGTRTMHFYVDGATEAAARIQECATTCGRAACV